jgi:type I restriction enzyme S subunit
MSWTSMKLGEAVTLKRGYDLPATQRKEGSVPIVSSSGVTGSHNVAKVTGPGVVTGRCGTLGEVYYLEEDFWPLNTALYVHDFKGNHPRFTAYFLQSVLRHTASDKAAVPGVNRNDLHAKNIAFPDLKTQQIIAENLSAYDDLIKNNRRRIQLLEESARLLYREWFVHLRFPGHEHVKVVDGVPEGWERKQLKHVLAKVKRPGKIQKSEYLSSGLVPCIDQSREFIGGFTNDEEAVIKDLPMIVFGDHTRILKFIDFPFACGADGTQLIASRDDKLSQVYLYFTLDDIDLSNYFYARHFKFLKDQYIPRPTDMLIEQFSSMAGSVMAQVKVLRQQIFELTQARDLLLPRLMNGEITV